MTRRNPGNLTDRVTRAAEAVLADQGTVDAIDVLTGIRWLEPSTVKAWQQGRIGCLADAIQTNPARVAQALRLLGGWAESKGLIAGEAHHVARTPQRQALQVAHPGDPSIAALWSTRWISPDLPEKQRERLAEQANRPPELVVIQPRNHDWKCHRCGGSGSLLIMEQPGPSCLRCAGLDDLEFLGAGDALLTRRAKAKSARHAVVVRFSRTRKQYERQGLLVEPQALATAEQEVAAQREKKNAATARRQA